MLILLPASAGEYPPTQSQVPACSFRNILSSVFFCQSFPPALPKCHLCLSRSFLHFGTQARCLKPHTAPLPSPSAGSLLPPLGPESPVQDGAYLRCTFSVYFPGVLCTCFIAPSRLNVPLGIREMLGPPDSPSTTSARGLAQPSWRAYPELTCQPHRPLCGHRECLHMGRKSMVRNRFHFPGLGGVSLLCLWDFGRCRRGEWVCVSVSVYFW